MRILITGASGFIGRACVTYFSDLGWEVHAISRTSNIDVTNPLVYWHSINNFNETTNWKELLVNIDVVLHLAGIAHKPSTPKQEYINVNVIGTEQLVKDCVLANVSQFIFFSSVSVYGRAIKNQLINEETKPMPEDDYGKSKLSAENKIKQLCEGTTLNWTIIRPPLVYGENAPGNMQRLINLISLGLPLPFGKADGLRSYLYLENLLNALGLIARNPLTYNQTFVISDDCDVSTAELIRVLADILNVSIWIFNVPISFLKALACIIGRKKDMSRLLDSFRLDCSGIKDTIGWKPDFSLHEGLKKTILKKNDF